MNNWFVKSFAALMFFSSSQGAFASTLYDESINGEVVGDASLGVIPVGDWSVLGSVNAQNFWGPDAYDRFYFTLNSEAVVSGFAIGHTVDVILILNQSIIAVSNLLAPQSNLFGTLSAGSYIMDFVPQGNIGQGSYEVTFHIPPVPLPSAGLCLFAGIAGLGTLRRKRRIKCID